MPEGTRVIGAAIVEFENGSPALERRAISATATDDLGHAAPVAHAVTPTDRTLSVARSIGGASIRREFPFSHINDAEIKLFEWAAVVLREHPNARGRISFLTMRSRNGGKILEPIPACSSCTNASFQLAGDFRGMQVASYAAVHPTAELDVGFGAAARPAKVVGKSDGAASRPNSEANMTEATTTAHVGSPDMRGSNVGGPSPRGEAIGAGITLAFMGINLGLNIINDHIQKERVQKALAEIEPGLRAQRQQHPELGVLLVFRYTQHQAPEDSLTQPGAVFGSVEYYTGRTQDEAIDSSRSTPAIRAGVGPYVEQITQHSWIPPIIAPSVKDLRTPFRSIALATFADGRSVLQDVEWGGVSGFDDEGTSSIPIGVPSRFLILKVPDKIVFYNGGIRVEVNIPIVNRAAQAGGTVPVVDLDPYLPGFNVSAACIFPADDLTAALFAGTIPTHDNLGQLRTFTNFGKARWVRPENIKIQEFL